MAKKPVSKTGASLEAKVNKEVVTSIVMAFGGKEFVKYEWRKVPSDPKSIKQAKDHPMLDVRPVQKRATKEPTPADENKSDKK